MVNRPLHGCAVADAVETALEVSEGNMVTEERFMFCGQSWAPDTMSSGLPCV